MTNFTEIKGINQFCGPAVLAAITGKTTDEVARVVSAIVGRDRIKSMRWEEMLSALDSLGFDRTLVPGTTGHTFFSCISSIRNKPGFYVVGLPKHFVAIEVTTEAIYFIDNHVKSAIKASQSARLMQKVDVAYQVIKRRDPVLVSSKIHVARSGGSVTISRIHTYDNEQVKPIVMGSFRYSYDVDLQDIVNGLNELIADDKAVKDAVR